VRDRGGHWGNAQRGGQSPTRGHGWASPKFQGACWNCGHFGHCESECHACKAKKEINLSVDVKDDQAYGAETVKINKSDSDCLANVPGIYYAEINSSAVSSLGFGRIGRIPH